MAKNKMAEKSATGTIPGVVSKQGGYRELKSYQSAEIVYDATVDFCDLYVAGDSGAHDQMIEAAHGGKQNIAEGSKASPVCKKPEFRFTGEARTRLETLLLECQDFLQQRELEVWDKDSPDALKIRALAYESDKSYASYKSHIRRSPESGANTLICLINQATYLLRRQLEALERQLVSGSGFRSNCYRTRRKKRA